MNLNISFDNITVVFIFSQIFTLLAYLSIAMTFMVKERKLVLIFSLGNIFSFAIASILLVLHGTAAAWTAFGAFGIAIVRNIAFLINDAVVSKRRLGGSDSIGGQNKKITLFDTFILVFVIIGTLAVVIIFNATDDKLSALERILSFLPAIATINYTVSIYQKNIKIYRIMSVPTCILWIIYLIFILNPVGILLESVLLGVVISSIGFYKLIENEKIKKENITK